MSWAERFRLKAAVCRELAESAQFPQIKVIFTRLAVSYETLTVHEERFERELHAALSPSLAVDEEPLESPLNTVLLPPLAVDEELFEKPSDAALLPPLRKHEERLERALYAALLPSLAEADEEATVNSERSWSPAR